MSDTVTVIAPLGNHYRLSWQTMPLAEQPCLRRDRLWVRPTLQDAGSILLLVGGVEGNLASTRTWGIILHQSSRLRHSPLRMMPGAG